MCTVGRSLFCQANKLSSGNGLTGIATMTEGSHAFDYGLAVCFYRGLLPLIRRDTQSFAKWPAWQSAPGKWWFRKLLSSKDEAIQAGYCPQTLGQKPAFFLLRGDETLFQPAANAEPVAGNDFVYPIPDPKGQGTEDQRQRPGIA